MYNSLIILLLTFFAAISLAFVSMSYIFVAQNTIFSVFNLVLVFLSASIIMILVDLEFFALVYVPLYVGAVIVFLLFTLMTINLRFDDTMDRVDEIGSDKNFSFFVLLLFSIVFHNLCFVNFKCLATLKSLTVLKINYFLANRVFKFVSGPSNSNFEERSILANNFISNTGYFKLFPDDSARPDFSEFNLFILSGIKFKDSLLAKRVDTDFNFYHAESIDNLVKNLSPLVGIKSHFYSIDAIINSHSGFLSLWTKFKFYDDLNLIALSIFTEMLPLFLLVAILLLLAMIIALKFALTNR